MLECSGKKIYLVCGATDMRKGLDGLAAIANLRFACVSFGSAMFI
ncbi:IS66 family insertion sequence element accessory protein TnpB, partial [Cloacibacillus evryensis]